MLPYSLCFGLCNSLFPYLVSKRNVAAAFLQYAVQHCVPMKEQSGLLLGNNSMCLKNKALGWGRCCSDVSAAVPGIALLSWLWAPRLGKGGVLCCAHLTPLQLSAPDSSSLPILSCCAVMLCADSREPRATGGGDLWYRANTYYCSDAP